MASPSLANGYVALGAMLVVPQYVLIHPYLHLLIVAPLLVWMGCQRALAASKLSREASGVETVSKKDAMQFPLIGSAVLFGLYVVVKLVKKEYLDLLLLIYFSTLGTFGVFSVIQPPLAALLGGERYKQHNFSFHYKFWKRKGSEGSDPIEFSMTVLDVPIFALCAGVGAAYGLTGGKKWWLNNILGCAFSVQGLELIEIGSYAIGVILLCGLFVYDVFWVFGTDVMVAVAKGLNAPVKILFPKALGVSPVPCSMLGLGDIVIPGIFVSLMLRYDHAHGLASQPYFTATLVAYVIGLGATLGVMHFFDSAQPALLYLVPACIGASLAVAASRGELAKLANFSVMKKEEEDAEDEKKAK